MGIISFGINCLERVEFSWFIPDFKMEVVERELEMSGVDCEELLVLSLVLVKYEYNLFPDIATASYNLVIGPAFEPGTISSVEEWWGEGDDIDNEELVDSCAFEERGNVFEVMDNGVWNEGIE